MSLCMQLSMENSMRKLYQAAIEWIAENDEPRETNETWIESQLTVLLVADLFNVSPSVVVSDVLMERLE